MNLSTAVLSELHFSDFTEHFSKPLSRTAKRKTVLGRNGVIIKAQKKWRNRITKE